MRYERQGAFSHCHVYLMEKVFCRFGPGAASVLRSLPVSHDS